MTRRWPCIVIGVLYLFPVVAESQIRPLPFEATVQLRVTSADDELRSRFLSCMNSELRRLSGVRLVDSKAQYRIEVVVAPTSTLGGHTTAFAVSYIALLAFSPDLIRSMGERMTPPVSAKFLARVELLTTHQYSYYPPELVTGAMSDLRSVCERLAAKFDTESLEETRKAADEVDRELDKLLQDKQRK